MKTILMTAYDIDPYKGSEAATGWNFVLQAARYNKVVAVTRANNKEAIEQYIQEYNINIEDIEFYYYDFPYWLRFWKRGAKGSSLYFYLWQMFMPFYIKKNSIKFDIAHNVNFHADAFPTFLWILNKPTVWGPINHNEKIPRAYVKNRKEYLKDRFKWIIKNINWNIDPFMLLAKKKVDIIVGGNSSVRKRLKIDDYRFVRMSQVASNEIDTVSEKNSQIYNILVVGRFLTIKSFDIALYSYNKFYSLLDPNNIVNVKLTIIGKGPLDDELKNIANKLESKHSIEFIEWVDKEKMNKFYQNANIFLFPSHEGAGMVVAEAMSHGLPVVCFDNYGPGEIVGDQAAIKVQYCEYTKTIDDFADALKTLYTDTNLYKKLSKNSLEHFKKYYTWDSKGEVLKSIYDMLLNKEKVKS